MSLKVIGVVCRAGKIAASDIAGDVDDYTVEAFVSCL